MTRSPYSEVGPRLVQLGYSAIPICPGSKAPGLYAEKRWGKLPDWSQFCERLPTEEDVQRWSRWPRAGVGVCLGPASGVVAIDFDTHAELWPALERHLEKSPVVKRGEKGYTAFYRYAAEQSRRWLLPGGRDTVVELLAVGRQTIIPPTIHPVTNRPYAWDGAGLTDLLPEELPSLPENLPALFDATLGTAKTAREDRPWVPQSERPSPEMIARALSFIDPDCDYHTWVSLGMAVHSEYPDGRGFAVWNAWSSGGKKYRPKEMQRKWESFRSEREITIATLFDAAKARGFAEWGFDEEKRLEKVSPVLRPCPKPAAKADDASPPRLSLPDEFVFRAPGLVGELTRWIVETAIKPQPVLALGAALAAVGVLKGHRVRTETNLRTNLYTLGLARSGSGKNHPLNAIRSLFRNAGCPELLGGEPASEPGLVQVLREGFGRSILLWDEMGHAISAMSNPRAGHHYSLIMSTLTRLFSNASSSHDGKVLAAGAREAIEQPCLCVFGVTVPERFFETLTNDNAIDGFLPRWLVFEVETNKPPTNRAGGLREVPQRLIDAVRCINAMPIRPPAEVGRLNHDQVDPLVVPFTDGARDMYWAAQDYFDDLAEEAAARGEPTGPVWVRAAEHGAKIALTVAERSQIVEEDLAWSLELVECQCRTLCDSILARIGQNSQERNTKKVLGIIRKAGNAGITRSKLCLKTQWLTATELNGIVNTLIDSEQIAAVKDEREGAGRRAVVYKAL